MTRSREQHTRVFPGVQSTSGAFIGTVSTQKIEPRAEMIQLRTEPGQLSLEDFDGDAEIVTALFEPGETLFQFDGL